MDRHSRNVHLFRPLTDIETFLENPYLKLFFNLPSWLQTLLLWSCLMVIIDVHNQMNGFSHSLEFKLLLPQLARKWQLPNLWRATSVHPLSWTARYRNTTRTNHTQNCSKFLSVTRSTSLWLCPMADYGCLSERRFSFSFNLKAFLEVSQKMVPNHQSIICPNIWDYTITVIWTQKSRLEKNKWQPSAAIWNNHQQM